MPGVGVGIEATQVIAKLVDERVVSLSSYSKSTRETGESMRDLLVARLGPPTLARERYAGWAHQDPIQLRWFCGLHVEVGAPLRPPDPRALERLISGAS